MRFVCESCRAQYMINDDKVGPKGVKVRCRKCGYVITVKRAEARLPESEPGDSIPTQVIQSPMADLAAALASKGSSPDNFLGADEDEIGAAFDQVLKGGTGSSDSRPGAGGSDEGDEHESTKVLDAAMVAQLAKESGSGESTTDNTELTPESNWFVAVNDRQTGPLPLEKVKEYWDKGEIGPDSLCWREGFQDWIPVSEVKGLAVVLAPKPPRPIVVPAATVSSAPVASVPVQSAFAAGAVAPSATPEAEAPAPAAAAVGPSPEETGAWRPSAGSVLATLVKDEMAAMAKVPPKPSPPPGMPEPLGRLIDIPEEKAPPPTVARTASGPFIANPPMAYQAPEPAPYRTSANRGIVVALSAVVGVVLVGLMATVAWLAVGGRATPQPVIVQPAVIAQPPPVGASPPPTGAQPAPQPGVGASPGATPALAATHGPEVGAGQPAVPVASSAMQGAVASARTASPEMREAPSAREGREGRERPSRKEGKSRGEGSEGREPREPREPKEGREPREESRPSASSSSDDFDSVFKVPQGGKREEPKRTESSRREAYVPPAPGQGGDVKESLSQSDIMEVVVSNKSALVKCAEEQRQKEPGSSGKLVVRWSIQPSGRPTSVVVVSEEFANTYMASCVMKVIKGWTFPRAKSQADPFTLPVKF